MRPSPPAKFPGAVIAEGPGAGLSRESAPRQSGRGWARSALPCAVLALAFAVRLFDLQSKALWWDEGITVFLARLSPAEYWDLRWMDIHPPLYRLLLMIFVAPAGSSDFAVRFFSVSAGLLLVALVYALGAFVLGRTGGLLAAALAALSPFAIFHAQEAKMYALLPALTTLSLIAAERLFRGRTTRAWWVLLVIASALALWIHYYAATIWLAINLTYLTLRIRRAQSLPAWRPWLIAQALIALSILPWAVLEGARIPADADRTIGAATLQPLDFLAGIWATLTGGYAAQAGGAAAAPALAFLLLVILALCTLRGRERWTLLMALALAVPLLAGVLISLRYPYNAPRFFIVSVSPLALLAAGACKSLFQRWPALGVTGGVAALALTAVGVVSVYASGSFTDDYRPLLAQLRRSGRPEDVIIAGYPWQSGYVHAYTTGYDRVLFPPPADLSSLAARAPRIWVLYYLTPEGTADYTRTFLEGNGFQRTLAAANGDSRIALFVRK